MGYCAVAVTAIALVVSFGQAAFAAQAPTAGIRFQAHRGGLAEYPENTLAAYRASWALNALPELDLRTTQDGVFICLHDGTLARTTDAPDAIKDTDVSKLTLDAVRSCDAGVRFDAKFAGEKVPTLEEVFAEMQGRPEREIYLDFKEADVDKLGVLIQRYAVAGQIIYCHDKKATCVALAQRVPGLRTMLWIGGKPEEKRAAFAQAAAEGFQGLNQVQLHLAADTTGGGIQYDLPPDYLKEALAQTRAAGVDLEVLPFAFDDASLGALLDLGLRWYATDNPNRFAASVAHWVAGRRVYIQAHRGAVDEAPENTMAAYRHAWGVEGAVPEMDVQTTRDGVMVLLHDDTPGRTTTAPAEFKDKPVSEITFDELRQWDAGVTFDAKFAGEKVPALREVLAEMQGHPERQVYLDLKGIDLDALKAMLAEYGVTEQVIFVKGNQADCIEVLEKFPGARTMTWLSGTPASIKEQFAQLAATRFKGISQLQFHLRVRKVKPEIVYLLEPEFLASAQQTLEAAGAELQLRPFAFDGPSLRRLMDLGVRWFVADAPAKFAAAVAEARKLAP